MQHWFNACPSHRENRLFYFIKCIILLQHKLFSRCFQYQTNCKSLWNINPTYFAKCTEPEVPTWSCKPMFLYTFSMHRWSYGPCAFHCNSGILLLFCILECILDWKCTSSLCWLQNVLCKRVYCLENIDNDALRNLWSRHLSDSSVTLTYLF